MSIFNPFNFTPGRLARRDPNGSPVQAGGIIGNTKMVNGKKPNLKIDSNIYFRKDDFKSPNGQWLKKDKKIYVKGRIDIIAPGYEPVNIIVHDRYIASMGVGGAECRLLNYKKDEIDSWVLFKPHTFEKNLPSVEACVFFSCDDPRSESSGVPSNWQQNISYYIITNNKGESGEIEYINKEGCWETNKRNHNDRSVYRDGEYQLNTRFWSAVVVNEVSDWDSMKAQVIVDNTPPFVEKISTGNRKRQEDSSARKTLCAGDSLDLHIEFDQQMLESVQPVVEIEYDKNHWEILTPNQSSWSDFNEIKSSRWTGTYVLPKITKQTIDNMRVKISKSRGIGIFKHHEKLAEDEMEEVIPDRRLPKMLLSSACCKAIDPFSCCYFNCKHSHTIACYPCESHCQELKSLPSTPFLKDCATLCAKEFDRLSSDFVKDKCSEIPLMAQKCINECKQKGEGG